MTDLDDEDDLPKPSPFQPRWASIKSAMLFASPVIAMGWALVAGYFSYTVFNTKPPPDLSKLAISILKSGDASPEMRNWATGVLGIQTDILQVK
ncbi:MAG: hypothetical protein WBG88_04330 [Mesorhizobium sp.]